MSRRTMRTAVLALACVLTGRLAVADAQSDKSRCPTPDMKRVVYPVADLVVPIPGCDAVPGPYRLTELIRSVVAPASWREKGGPATLEYHPQGMALAVEQTAEAHGAVADLLKALRRLQEVEVAVELRIVQMSEELAQEFHARAGFEPCKIDGEKTVATTFLTEKELYPWLRLFQTDPAANIMAAPKMTVFNGQQAQIAVGQKQSFVTEYKVVRTDDEVAVVPNEETVEVGLRCGLLPVVSADRRFVQLKLDFRQTDLVGPAATMPVRISVARDGGSPKEFRGVVQQPRVQTLALRHAATIADGRTMVVSLGSVMTAVRAETTEPVFLSKVPYVNRLFRNAGYAHDSRAVFLFVTPRIIIVNEEEEAAPAGVR